MTALTLADVTIVRASPAQVKATYEHHYPHWGQPRGFKTVDDYFERETGLTGAHQPWVKNDGFVTWALVPRSDPDTTDLLASCETYRRKALILSPGDTTPRETVSYGIASVFCQPNHRGRAWPRHLLSLLHHVLASPEGSIPEFPTAWGAAPVIKPPYGGDAAFSVLYSDVGPTYYSRCTIGDSRPGWVNVDEGKRVYDLKSIGVQPASTDGWEWLDMAGAEAMEAEASKRITRDFPTVGDKTKTRVAILPDNGWFKNGPQRYLLGNDVRPDAKFGVILPAPASGGERPFMTWSLKAKDGSTDYRLQVGHRSGDISLEQVLAAAQHEKCYAVEAWVNYGWKVEPTTIEKDMHSIACIADYTTDGKDQIEWEFAERYPWM